MVDLVIIVMSRLENSLTNEIWMERVKQHRPKQLLFYSLIHRNW